MEIFVKGEKKNKGEKLMLFFALALLILAAFFFIYTKYASVLPASADLQKSNEISPQEEIIINFSKPVISGYFGWKIRIYPEVGFKYRWENYNRRLIITPENPWLLENEYQVSLSGKNVLLYPINKTLSFKTIAYPKMIEFNPAPGEKDVVLDIEDPIQAIFDKPLDDFKVKFTITPFKELDFQIDQENNSISLMPKGELDKGQKYTIGIFVRYKEEKGENYRKIDETFFETKAVPPPAWSKDFSERLNEAKKFTEAKIKEGKYIDINVSSQVLSIFENGNLLDAFMVSTGKRGMPTPQGNFKVYNKFPRAWSKKYGLFMPYWMAMVSSGDFGIHELPEWPGGYKEGTNHLGTPVSHGCVRLGVGPAERVYNWAEIGTPVVIHS